MTTVSVPFLGGVSGEGGGSAISLGAEQNTFGSDVTESSDSAYTANKAAAAAKRDTYAGANAAWLAEYDADRSSLIRLVWTGGAQAFQRRNVAGDGWEDVTNVAPGVKGDDGEGTTKPEIEAVVRTIFTDDLETKLDGIEAQAQKNLTGNKLVGEIDKATGDSDWREGGGDSLVDQSDIDTSIVLHNADDDAHTEIQERIANYPTLTMFVSPAHIDKNNIPNRFIIELRYPLDRYTGNNLARANATQYQVSFGTVQNAFTKNFQANSVGRLGIAVPVTEAMRDVIEAAAVGTDIIVGVSLLNSDGVQVTLADGQNDLRSRVSLSLEVIESSAGEDEAARKGVESNLAGIKENVTSIQNLQAQIRSIERHGTPDNFRIVPGAVDTFDDLARTYRAQVLDPTEIPSNVDKLAVMVGNHGGDLSAGSIVDTHDNWDRSSPFSFTITAAQRDFFDGIITNRSQVEIRFLMLPDTYELPAQAGRVSLSEIVETFLATIYVGAVRAGVPNTLQAAVDGGDTAGVTQLVLPENYSDWTDLSLGLWENEQDRIAFSMVSTELLKAQTAPRTIHLRGNVAGSLDKLMACTWTPATRTVTLLRSDRIIYAQLR